MNQRLAFLLLSALLIVFSAWYFMPVRMGIGGFTDGAVLYKAARISSEAPGTNYYNLETLAAYPDPDGMVNIFAPYFYPPTANFLWKILPHDSARAFCFGIIWTDWLARIVSLIFVCLLSYRLSKNTNPDSESEINKIYWPVFISPTLFCISFFSIPYWLVSEWCQVSGLVATFIFTAVAAGLLGYKQTGRVLLIFGTMLKLFPIIFSPLIIKRKFSSWLGFALLAAAIPLLFLLTGVYTYTELLHFLGPKTLATANATRGLLYSEFNCSLLCDVRLLSVTGTGGKIAGLIYAAVMAGIQGSFFVLAFVRNRNESSISNLLILSFASALCMLSFWPLVWLHYYMLAFPFACLLISVKQIPAFFRLACAIYVLCFFFKGFYNTDTALIPFTRFGFANDLNLLVSAAGALALRKQAGLRLSGVYPFISAKL
ncbi:MAG: hypothetical protein V4543_01590 [Bacteroidota bacterium]